MWHLTVSVLYSSFFLLGKSFFLNGFQRNSGLHVVRTDDRVVSTIVKSDIMIESFDHAFMPRSPSISLWRDVPLNEIIPGKEAWKLLDLESLQEISPSSSFEFESRPPTLIDYLSGLRSVQDHHLNVVQNMTAQLFKKTSLKKSGESVMKTIQEAYMIAYLGLWGKQTQRSREVSINRAKGVAEVLGNLDKTEVDVILAAILSQVVSELDASENDVRFIKEELRRKFGDSVYELTESYLKLPKFMSRKAEYTPEQSENHIQMLVAMLPDYRALYIRLADRIHALRVLKQLPLDGIDRVKIAQEALSVYVPIAHRMNIQSIKSELEELAFRVLGDPERLQSCKYAQLKAGRAYNEANEDAEYIIQNDEFFKSQNATITKTFRVKSKFQLHEKMVRKNLSSESDVRDVLGFRVIIEVPMRAGESEEVYAERSNSLCYHFVQRLTNMSRWVPAERGFKDYIKGKKENGYQSLHQYIRHKDFGINVEMQVRTRAMHIQAELGDAAHWYYKDLKYRPEVANTKTYKLAWRSEEQARHQSGAELIALAKKQLNANRVFVFLDDKSTVINLPVGATSLDAAFAIHSSLGLSVSTVFVNGKAVGLKRPLRNGEVITVKAAAPNTITAKLSWLDNVKTTKAQQDLKKYFKSSEKTYMLTLGLVHLMATIGLNSDKIAKRYATSKVSFPNALRLAKSACDCCGASNLAELLVSLSILSEEQMAEKLGQLLCMSSKDIEIPSRYWAMLWARKQGSYAWENKDLRDDILLPVLRSILPQLNFADAEQHWSDLVGADSLTSETSSFVPVTIENSETVEEAAVDELAEVSHESSPLRVRSHRGIPLIYSKSYPSDSYSGKDIKPYSLNALAIPSALRRNARRIYGDKTIRREMRQGS